MDTFCREATRRIKFQNNPIIAKTPLYAAFYSNKSGIRTILAVISFL